MDSIETVVADSDVEFASGLMWAAGVEGIEERRESAETTRLIAGVPPTRTDAVVAALEPRWSVQRGVMETEQWLDAWRPYAKAVRISERFVVEPPWVAPIAGPQDTAISLDPGRAWGHGAHPSTVLVARELAEVDSVVRSAVLDVGCGSGLLSILAAIRGAAPVVAIDVDEFAVAATLANAAVNGMDGRIEASMTPVALIDQRFDIVVANIGVRVLTELASPIAGTVRTGGLLILSGLLDEQVEATVDHYPGFAEVRRPTSEGWSAVVLRRLD